MKDNKLNKKSFYIPGKYNKELQTDYKYCFKNFTINEKEIIGTGAFSNVHLCINNIDSKQYAVKIIPKSVIISNNLTMDIIYSEIDIHERLEHPNIVRLYSHYENETSFYLFMEYIEGETLFSHLTNGHSESDTCKYFSQAINAINFCHENEIIHRDIKLENFIIDEQGIVKLCDFGWSTRITSKNPQRATICGTYEYMAPELIKEKEYDYSIDVWAMGILLYELLHGYSPFRSGDDDDYTQIFKNVLKYNFHIEKELSRNCVDLIMKLLSPTIKERITMKDVIRHPWFDDWLTDSQDKDEVNDSNKDNDLGRGTALFNNVLDVVSKKNQKTKAKKKKKTKAKGIYKKGHDDNDEEVLAIEVEHETNSVQEAFYKSKLISNKKLVPFQNEHNISNNEDDIIIIPSECNEQKVNQNKSNSFSSHIKQFEYSSDEDNKNHRKSNEDNDNSNSNSNSFNDNNHLQTWNITSSTYDQVNHNKYHIHNDIKKESYYALFDDGREELNKEEIETTLDIFKKAESLKKQNEKRILVRPAESFWDKFFAPFRCGQQPS